MADLSSSRAWPFLLTCDSKRDQRDLSSLEEECDILAQCLEAEYKDVVPRSFGRFRLILHAYSGRRRLGDVQFYLDQMAAHQTDYALHLISMDIVNDQKLGDAMNPDTCQFWRNAIRQRYVLGFIGGPPCESWSYARGKAAETGTCPKEPTRHGPRVIRDLCSLWGFDSVSIRELS